MTTSLKRIIPRLDETTTTNTAASQESIKLVFVDDDDDFREAASWQLQDRGFDVVSLSNGVDMLAHFEQGNGADAIVLDWKLPTTTGLDLLSRLQRRGVLVPVVFLTGVPSTANENDALDQGAFDFIDKTRGVEILAKRLRLIVEAGKKPAEMPREEVLTFGELTLRPKVSRAYWRGADLGLTITEFKIVRRLVTPPDEFVNYRQIYDCVQGVGFIAGSGVDGYRTNVRSSVKRIRNKFRAVDANFSEIENFPVFGYRWRTTTSVSG